METSPSTVSEECISLAPGQSISIISVIIVTYNGQNYISDCLHSLYDSGSAELDVVVVDNSSSDRTVEIVGQEFPGVHTLACTTNHGYGYAINKGARSITDSEYIAIVNQDVISTPKWLEHLVRALEADPGAAIAMPKILLKGDPERINTCGNLSHYTGITTCRGYGMPALTFTQREDVPVISGAAFVMRRSVFEALGGFDPQFFMYLEDTDLSLRAYLAGYRCIYVPESMVLHEYSPHFSTEKIYYLERNRLIMLLKLYRWRTLLMLLPALLLTELAVWGYCLLRGQRGVQAKLRSYGWVCSHLPQILQSRRQMQSLRQIPDKDMLKYCSPNLRIDELGSHFGQAMITLLNPFFRSWHRIAQAALSW